MGTTLSEKKLNNIVKESVQEALEAEIMKLRAFVLPEFSAKEQKDIEKRYGAPSQRFIKSYAVTT